MGDPGRHFPFIDGKEFSIDALPEKVGKHGELRIKMVINMIHEDSFAAPADIIVCAKCRRSYLFKELKALKKHLKRRHGMDMSSKDILECSYCRKKLNEVQYYGSVLLLSINDESRCKMCQTFMNTKYIWALHILQEHTRVEENELKKLSEHLEHFSHVQIEIQLYTVPQGFQLKTIDPTGKGKSLKYRATFSKDDPDFLAEASEITRNSFRRLLRKPMQLLEKLKIGSESIFTKLFSTEYPEDFDEYNDPELFEVIEEPKDIDCQNEIEPPAEETTLPKESGEDSEGSADKDSDWSTDEDEVVIGKRGSENKDKKECETDWETEEEITYENFKPKEEKYRHIGVQFPEGHIIIPKPKLPYPTVIRTPYNPMVTKDHKETSRKFPSDPTHTRPSYKLKSSKSASQTEHKSFNGFVDTCDHSILNNPVPVLRKRSQFNNIIIDEEIPYERRVHFPNHLPGQMTNAFEKIQGDTNIDYLKSPSVPQIIGPYGESVSPQKCLSNGHQKLSLDNFDSDSSDEPGGPITIQAEVHASV